MMISSTPSDTTTIDAASRTTYADPHGRRLALVSAFSAAGFVLLLILAGLFDPGYSQLSESISALASTESSSAAAMIAGFACLGATAIAAGAALLRSLPGGLARAAAVMVVLGGAATLADGYFRQSCSSLEQQCLDREASGDVTGAHVLHNLIALPLFTMLVVAGFLLAFAVRRTPRMRHLWRPTLLAACLTLVAFVWFGSGAYGSFGGLVQRALVLFGYGTPPVIALWATRPSRRYS